MVNATTSDGKTVQTQRIREERWREKLKDDGSSTRMNRQEIKRSGIYEIQDHTNRSTTTMHPQVRKTGVDAVHESCSQMVYIMKNCNL
jgi:hypothetical protein